MAELFKKPEQIKIEFVMRTLREVSVYLCTYVGDNLKYLKGPEPSATLTLMSYVGKRGPSGVQAPLSGTMLHPSPTESPLLK